MNLEFNNGKTVELILCDAGAGYVSVQAEDDEGYKFTVAAFAPDGELMLIGGVPKHLGFKLDSSGQIKLYESEEMV